MIKKEKAEKLIILFIIGLSAFVDILRIFYTKSRCLPPAAPSPGSTGR